MKTQISELRSGTKNQILNKEVDYSNLPKSSSHIGHSGSNRADVEKVWQEVINQNPESMRIRVKGIELELKANWSLSGKSVNYAVGISSDDLRNLFYLTPAKTRNPYISIQYGNIIMVSNGKNSYRHVCPSLIEII